MDSDGGMEAEVWKQLRAGEGDLAALWRSIRMSARAGGAAGGDPDAPLTLGQIEKLRAAHGPEMARFASLQDELTRRARKRFPEGRPLFWTSKGIEQATPAAVSEYRASRFAADATGDSVVWDACCGVGSDAVAILRALELRAPELQAPEAGDHGSLVIATDWDAESARCAAANLRAAFDEGSIPTGAAARTRHVILRGDLRKPPLARAAVADALVLLDPDRRPDGEHREPRPERWAPPLSQTLQLARSARGACIKLPPSLDATAEGLDCESETPLRLEWISLDGEMKELALWTGSLGTSPGMRLATALRTSQAGKGTAAAHYSSHAAPVALPAPFPVDRLGPGMWLVELDPTLWQSELAGHFCAEHDLAPIEAEVRGMFMVSDRPPTSPFTRAWPILESLNADRKRVRKALRARQIGPVTVKKRNHPRTSLELEAMFRGSGPREGLLAVFRVPGRRGSLGSVAVILGAGAPETGAPEPGTTAPGTTEPWRE
ncbi:hypothetical protein Poly30_53120 [Planctomycetes bacterium Poly30]|uniref:THUMP-like domain-containing protein n=1 Tax=Saltatorellus ferox TaxID=2528018 RepID=A0A518F084_9BACT|nr:hypothetical protein Poly30_53120 [Planctomycetes bacterium Poly30]